MYRDPANTRVNSGRIDIYRDSKRSSNYISEEINIFLIKLIVINILKIACKSDINKDSLKPANIFNFADRLLRS